MPIRDRETWVKGLLDRIRDLRSHLTPERRELQQEALSALSTRQINEDNIQRSNPELSTSDKRGAMFEFLVKAQTDYPTQSTIEEVVSTYLLAALRSNFFAVGPYDSSLYNPDDIIVRVEGRTATVVSIIEMKHTTHNNRRFRAQLQGMVTDLGVVVGNINHYLEHDQPLPMNKLVSWPEEVKVVEFKEESLDKVLYIPAEREAKVSGWIVNNGLFSVSEISVITRFAWRDLVAKGGATTDQKGEEVPIHRPPSELVVPQKEAETVTNQGPIRRSATSCERCNDEPLISIETSGGRPAPLRIRTREHPEGICLGMKCGLDEVLNLHNRWHDDALEAIAETQSRFPNAGDYAAARTETEAKFDKILTGDMTIPSRLQQAMWESKGVRDDTERAWAPIWIERGLELIKDIDTDRARTIRNRLEFLENKRQELARQSAGRVDEVDNTSAEEVEVDPTVSHVKNIHELWRSVKVVFSQAEAAKQNASIEADLEGTRSMMLERIREVTGKKDLSIGTAPPIPVAASEPPTATVEEHVEAKNGNGAAAAVRMAATANDTRPCPACGTEVPNRYAVCTECGASMEQPTPKPEPRKCGSCGSTDPGPGKRCGHCGAELPAVEVPAEAQQPEPTAEPAPAPTAAATLEPAANPAPAPTVAATVEPAATPTPTVNFCPNCGQPPEPGAKFCSNCGNPFS